MRDWLTKDFGWKLISFFLAVIIWLTVHKIYEEPAMIPTAAGNTFTYDNLRVGIVSAAANVRDFRVNPAAVRVTVSGPATLKIGDVHALVDLTETNLAHDARLPVEISAPASVTIISVEPSSVLVIIPPAPEKKP